MSREKGGLTHAITLSNKQRRSLLAFYTMFSLIWLLTIHQASAIDTQDFTFLVEGEMVEFTQSTKTDRLTLIVTIDLDQISGRKAIKAIDTIISSWAGYPAFSQTPDIGLTYLSLTEKAVDDLLRVGTLLDRVVQFREPNSPLVATYSCTYKHEILLKSEMESQVFNLQSNLKRLDTSWTSTSILADIDKDTALRHFATLLTETIENWEDNFNIMLSTLDTLASNKIPPEVQGHYQQADCIGNYFEESLIVLECYSTDLGYYCDLEVTVPLAFTPKRRLLPVHYDDIRLRGGTQEHYFVKEEGAKIIELLECNHYDFNKESIPVCELITLKTLCNQALISEDTDSVIKHCNFTQHSPPNSAIRTATGGLLIQGNSVSTLVQNDTNYVSISDTTPIVVHSPANIKVKHGKEEFIFTTISKQLITKVSVSTISPDQISAMKVKYLWQDYMETFDSEDFLQFIMLILQVILYPIALAGVAIGIRARRKVMAKLFKNPKEKNKQIYRSNKIALRRLN